MKYISLPVSLFAFQLSLLLVGSAWGSEAAANSPTLTPPTVSVSNLSTSGHATSSLSANASSVATSTSTAQYPSLSGVPACVTNCLESAISDVNCTSVVDVNCFCKQGKFPKDIVSCISVTCPSELTSAEKLSQQFCNIASASPSLSFPKPTITSTSSTLSGSTSGLSTSTSSSSGIFSTSTAPSSATSATSSVSATQTGAARALAQTGSGTAAWLAAGVGMVGAVVGVLCV